MPSFAYVARDSAGKRVTGEVMAPTTTEAAKLLRRDGKFVVSVGTSGGPAAPDSTAPAAEAPKPAATSINIFAPRVRPDEVRAFAQNLSVMLTTGVSLADALETCVDNRNSPAFGQTLADVIATVQGGSNFSSALARHPRVFSPLFVNMVKASEASGQLGPMLRRVAAFLNNQHEMSRKIKGAVAYPAVMAVLAIGVLIFMMTFVLPKFTRIYAGREDALPKITKVLMAFSDWMSHYGLYVGPAVLLPLFGFIIYLRRPAGRPLADRMKLAIPLMGRLFHQTYMARSLRTLGTLIQAGVSILEGVELTGSAVGSATYAHLWAATRERLQGGRQLSEALVDNKLMPRAIVKMLQAGERGGRVGEVMDAVAGHCEEEVSTTIKTVTSLIEPAIVIFMGTVIGVIVLALLLPIFTLSKALRPH